MTRGLTAATLAATGAEVVRRTMAVDLDFASGPVRYVSLPADITIAGATFLGVGALGSVAVVEEGADLRSYGLVVSLTGIPRDMVALALLQSYQGRRGTVWEVPLDANWQPVADPTVIFRGRMDQMDVTLGETASVRVRLENRLTDWDRPRVRRFTDEDQRAAHPTDRFFEFVSATAEKDLIWPQRTFFERR
jgi:hypothetical protein